MTPTQIKQLQLSVGLTGRDVDGIAGRGTYTRLFAKLGAPAVNAAPLGLAAAVNFPRYAIDASPLRVIHFLGQCALESGRFRYMREIWGPTKTQLGYEGRKDLGNTEPGDGKRFMGRSPGMVTGRANYRRVAGKMGVDVEAEPTLLERPDLGLWAFCIWWDENAASRWADLDEARALSRLVNRGDARATLPANHEADRIAQTNTVRALFGTTPLN